MEYHQRLDPEVTIPSLSITLIESGIFNRNMITKVNINKTKLYSNSIKNKALNVLCNYLTHFICSAVPPDVALVMAQAASFLVLNSALLRISTSIGMILLSITACIKSTQIYKD